MGYNDGNIFGTILGNIDGITLDIDVRTELGILIGSYDGSNDGKIEGSLIRNSLGYTDERRIRYDEGINLASTYSKVIGAMQYTRYPSTARGSSLAVNDRTLDVRVTSDRPSTT